MLKNTDMTSDELRSLLGVIRDKDRAIGLISGELVISEPSLWFLKNGIIHFTVTSNGLTVQEETICSNGKKILVSRCVQGIKFRVTEGVKYPIVVIPSSFWLKDNERLTGNIFAEAKTRRWTMPKIEVGYLIRQMFTDQQIRQMGFGSIITMHESIEDYDGIHGFLGTNPGDNPGLSMYFGTKPHSRWGIDHGFAFSEEAGK